MLIVSKSLEGAQHSRTVEQLRIPLEDCLQAQQQHNWLLTFVKPV